MGDPRLSRLVVSEDHIQSINAYLDRLVEDGSTECALLLDRSGQLIAWRGDTQRHDLDTFGALLAGNFASAREIARVIGEDSFGAVLQQGQRQHVFTALVSEHWMLSVVFDARTPVGLVRVLCGRVASDLTGVHSAVIKENEGAGGWAIDQSFRVLAQRTIDLLLQEGSKGT